jgi:hypothetical protein
MLRILLLTLAVAASDSLMTQTLTAEELCAQVLTKNAPGDKQLIDACKEMQTLQAKARENIKSREKKEGFETLPLVK